MAWTVVINPFLIPNLSSINLSTGAKQLVVQLAALITLSLKLNISSLTPYTIVLTSSLAGALIITCFAPASRCAWHFSAEVNTPVHSRTTSTLSSLHGNLDGSLSAYTLILLPFMNNSSSSKLILLLLVLWTESYL